MYVPESIRQRILADLYDFLVAGHVGASKTLNLVVRDYHWPGLQEVKVSLEFLQMGSGFVPNIKAVKLVGEGIRAGIGELVRMKANN